MPLVRDRYEQTVRFSWLLRSPHKDEYEKYARAFFAKMNSLIRDMPPSMRAWYERMAGAPPEWATAVPSKETRQYFEAWNSLDLHSMVMKRDKLPPLAETPLAKQRLADLYNPVYVHFSSVSHYDRYSIELLGLQKIPSGTFVLAPEPYWPAMLASFNTLFDLVQCFEAARLVHKKEIVPDLDKLFDEWQTIVDRFLPG